MSRAGTNDNAGETTTRGRRRGGSGALLLGARVASCVGGVTKSGVVAVLTLRRCFDVCQNVAQSLHVTPVTPGCQPVTHPRKCPSHRLPPFPLPTSLLHSCQAPLPPCVAMLHNTLSALLESVASRYAELSPADVGIGIGGGRLVIDNVKLRAETFNSPRLPFYVHQGRAGRLRINVPWSALSSSPVEVYLENVHLVAGPKLQTQSQGQTDVPSDKPVLANGKDATDNLRQGKEKAPWHQTSVGRLAFNVSVEMYGLKVEYRDATCVGIISVASLRAFSAGRDWSSRFVSLALDPAVDQAETTTAVAMRKLVKLAGVHWVMIPRRSAILYEGAPSNNTQESLDLESFESQSPILDGIAITIRVLLCTGKAAVETASRPLAPGMHAEIEVDLEEANVNLTARQMKWIDHILKQGFSDGGTSSKVNSRSAPGPIREDIAQSTKRRPRHVRVTDSPEDSASQIRGDVKAESARRVERADPSLLGGKLGTAYDPPPPPSDTESPYSSSSGQEGPVDGYGDEAIDAEIERVSEYDTDEHGEYDDNGSASDYNAGATDEKTSNGGLFSIWQAIVGENGDETVDDAAVALGLSGGYSTPDENDDSFEEQEEDHADHLYARNAVQAAARAGGVTVQLRLKTPDIAAWDLVEQYREDAKQDGLARKRLEDVEALLEEMEGRLHSAKEELRIQRERNTALMQEMEDLERLTGHAGRNKDAMIRQMEAALAKAERNLQAMYQTQFQQQGVAVPVPGLPVTVDVESEQAQKEPVGSRGAHTETFDEDETSRTESSATRTEEGISSQDGTENGPDQDEGMENIHETADEDIAEAPTKPLDETKSGERPGTREASEDPRSKRPPPVVEMSPRAENSKSELPQGTRLATSHTMQEVGLDSPAHAEVHMAKLSTEKLEQAMSSEGLTLI